MPKPLYHSYLLRLWQENGETESNWRFLLVNLTRKEEWGFTSLERLVTFLKAQMDEISTSERMPRNETETPNKH